MKIKFVKTFICAALGLILILLTACATIFRPSQKIPFSLGSKKTHFLSTINGCIDACKSNQLFLIDTGSTAIVVNSKSNIAQTMKKEKTINFESSIGKGRGVISHAKQIRIGGFKIPTTPFPVVMTDLSGVKNVIGRNITAIIGLPLLRHFAITYGYGSKSGILSLNLSAKPHNLASYKTLALNRNLNVNNFRINGVLLHDVPVDTGSSDMELTKSALSKIAGTCKNKDTHFAIAGKIYAGTEKKCHTIKIFGAVYHNVYFSQSSENEIGMSFISKNNFIIDYPNKKIYYKRLNSP